MIENYLSQDNTKIIRMYSRFIAFLPIICIYASGIPGLTAGDVCLGLFLLCSMFSLKRNQNKKTSRVFVFLCVYYVCTSMLSILFQNNPMFTDILIRITRFIFYIVVLLFVSKRYFVYNITSKWVIRISIFGTAFILIQYILYFMFSYILSGYLSFVPIYLKEYTTFNYSTLYSTHFFRPTSFFLEPAQYAQYAVLGLCLSLFSPSQKQLRTVLTSAIISVGIILSTSIQGIVFTAFLWTIWGVTIYLRSKNIKGLLLLLSAIVIIPLIAYSIYNTSVIQNSLSRILSSDSNIMNNTAVDARFGGFSAINNLDGIFEYIGLGFGQVPNDLWMSSAAYVWYGTGLVGLMLTVFLFIACFFASKDFAAKLICLMYFAMFWGAFIFNSYMLVFYFSFISIIRCWTSTLAQTTIRT